MIKVDENYYIDVDDNCYAVKIDMHKQDKKGSQIYTTEGYYGNLEGALKGVIKSMNKRKFSSGDFELKEALKIVQENNNRFEELLRVVLSM